MQDKDLMGPGEDWRGLGDPSERRKIQNRIAQRAYRRNMRERANKIEELQKRLQAYEGLHPPSTQGEDSAYEQNSNPSILLPEDVDVEGWCPQQATAGVAASHEPSHESFPDDSRFSHMQNEVFSPPPEQQSVNSPEPSTQQQLGCWYPTNSQGITTGPPPSAPSLPMESGIKSDGMLPLGLANLSAATVNDFNFAMADWVNNGRANKGRLSISLLHMAVAGNHVDTIRVLLQYERVRIDDVDGEGFTPLQRAVMSGRSEIVKLLLDHSAAIRPSKSR